MPSRFPTPDAAPTGSEAASPGRGVAVALFAGAGLALLVGGALLWRERAELVFLDMVASALAMCF